MRHSAHFTNLHARISKYMYKLLMVLYCAVPCRAVLWCARFLFILYPLIKIDITFHSSAFYPKIGHSFIVVRNWIRNEFDIVTYRILSAWIFFGLFCFRFKNIQMQITLTNKITTNKIPSYSINYSDFYLHESQKISIENLIIVCICANFYIALIKIPTKKKIKPHTEGKIKRKIKHQASNFFWCFSLKLKKNKTFDVWFLFNFYFYVV